MQIMSCNGRTLAEEGEFDYDVMQGRAAALRAQLRDRVHIAGLQEARGK